MVPGNRFAALCLVPVCLIGWLPARMMGNDVPFPPLSLSAKPRAAAWPAAALADTPVAPENGQSSEKGYPADENPRARAIPPPPTETIPPDTYGVPDIDFEQMPLGAITEGDPAGVGPIWAYPDALPAHSGFFARQPLRRHLRALYGPPQGRHRGIGRPLTDESWLYRPFSAGWFMGGMFGSPLIDDWLGISSGYFTGFRLGWDQNHYWGLEMQFAYGQMGLWDSALAKEQRRHWYVDEGWDQDDPEIDRLIGEPRDLELYQWAVSVMHYPWGDSQWRPYFSIGVGAAKMKFADIFLFHYDKTFFVLPLAVGVKYHWNDWLALRVECSDSFSIPGGGGLKALHNLSINGAVEIRFGGPRTAYWPWNPGRSYW